MPYLQIQDFAAGIDLRKSRETAPPGTLRALRNAVITAGGEVEKRKTLTALGTLPAGTTAGLAFLNKQLVVFGVTPAGSVTPAMPAFVTYQQLFPTLGGVVIDRVLRAQVFAGKIYVIVRYTDDTIEHFYDGVPVTDVAGEVIRAHKSKLFAADGVNLRSSAVRDATDWTTGAGASIIDVTTEDAGETELIGLEEYFGSLAVFGRTSIQIWAMDPDPALSQIGQVLGNTGLVTRNAVTRFGSGDVLFLADTGVRSLRARDIQSAAAVNDVGAPVDNLIAAKRAVLTSPEADTLTALVDPLTGRFWLTWGREVFVLTVFPNSRISAWSVFDFGIPLDYAIQAGSRVAVRSGDDLFLYGSVADPAQNPFDPNTPIGTAAELYDPTPVIFETPFLDAGDPGTVKIWSSLDVTCTGAWEVYVCPSPPTDPDEEPAWTKVAYVTHSTWAQDTIPLEMEGNHIAVRMVSVGATAATIASIALHHNLGAKG